MLNKTNQIRFFEETFLVINVSPKVVFGIFFFTLSNTNVDFFDQELWWRTYTIKEALPTIRYVELIGKKEFVATVLNPEHETYIVYVASLSSIPLVASPSSTLLDVHPSWRPQIYGLIAKKASTKVPNEYAKFADLFSLDLVSKLLKYTGINDHALEFIEGQQPPYGPIYNLETVDLETLKTYIGINLANDFIRPSKSLVGAPILFNWKSDGFLRLFVKYQGLNNLTIKNRYPLLLIGESLDKLRRAWQFT